MNMSDLPPEKIKENLNVVLNELKGKSLDIDPAFLAYPKQIEQIDEWINYADECGIAYESMVALLESEPIEISGAATVRLLEVALVFGFKTDRDEDKPYDFRAERGNHSGGS